LKKSTKLLVCSLLISFFISGCHETKEYQFNIVNFTDAEEIIIKFDINLGRYSKEIKVNFKNQQNIILKKEDFFIGYTSWGTYEVFFYPSIFSMENGGTVEVFIYDKPMVEAEGKVYRISPCEKISKYFLYFIEEGELVQII